MKKLLFFAVFIGLLNSLPAYCLLDAAKLLVMDKKDLEARLDSVATLVTEKVIQNLNKSLASESEFSRTIEGFENRITTRLHTKLAAYFSQEGEGATALKNVFSGAIENILAKFNESLGKNGQTTQALNTALDEASNRFSNYFAADGPGTVALKKALTEAAQGAMEALNTNLGEDGQTTQALNAAVQSVSEQAQHSIKNIIDTAGREIETNILITANTTTKALNEIMNTVEGGINRIGNNLDGRVDTILGKFNNKLLWAAGIVGGSTLFTVAGYYGIKAVDRHLMTPPIVTEKKTYTVLNTWFGTTSKPVYMIIDPSVKQQLEVIAKATKNIKKKIDAGVQVKYRNLLLYGPPGTGKTMFAKKLARESGMGYVIIHGPSFSQFKKGEGVTALKKLFAWANTQKGLIIFFDEIDSFLLDRSLLKDLDGDTIQVLLEFLAQTGEGSDRYMIVFATNRPDRLDHALGRRIADAVMMPLPKYAERVKLIALYRNQILLDARYNDTAFIASVDTIFNSAVIKDLAYQAEGLSGGDIMSFINNLKTEADVTDTGLITHEMIYRVFNQMKDKNAQFAHGFSSFAQSHAALAA